MADLYIIQNDHGLVKIGRSADVHSRVSALRSIDRCEIEIVYVFPGQGDHEEAAHLALANIRVTGEWFSGEPRALSRIKQYFKLPSDFQWPYSLDKRAAAKWLTWLEAERDHQARVRDFNRYLRLLRETPEGCKSLEAFIWRQIHPDDPRSAGASVQDDTGMKRVAVNPYYRDGRWQADELVPAYTRRIEDALTVWPTGARPHLWDGNAVSCCIAALQERRKRWSRLQGIESQPRFAGPKRLVPPTARLRILQAK